MATTPYRPVTWTDETVSANKLAQMANNDQWLFENGAKFRYTSNGLTRDSGLKIIAGKTPYGITGADAYGVLVYFGSFFSSGCKPIVTATIEHSGGWMRKYVSIRSLSGMGSEVDHRGMYMEFSTHERTVTNNIEAGGWFHWQAIGY